MNPDDASARNYVSAHAANVFLSEVRNTHLDVEALGTLNTFLDELLYTILKASGDSPLVTEHIRQGLLKTLPTSLGQAALLEAEIELHAYRDRAPKSRKLEGEGLSAEWAFQLLRLKCQGLSTMSDATEESQNAKEACVKDEMREAGLIIPSAGLITPAALYLTAVIEFISEHVLANVSRVVSRDSSRNSATVLDLFTALCEDHATYEVLKSLDVYKTLEGRFAKTTAHHNKPSPKGERIVRADTPRMSTDSNVTSSSVAPTVSHAHSRSSHERRFRVGAGRKSQDERRSHGKRESYLGDERRKSFASYTHTDTSSHQDPTLQKEFDDLMRSDATMKVSLTPDRLKNELGRRDSLPESPSPTLNAQRQLSFAIIEDEDSLMFNKAMPTSRRRRNSLSSSRNGGPPAPIQNRKRSATFTAKTSANKSPFIHPNVHQVHRGSPHEVPVIPGTFQTSMKPAHHSKPPFITSSLPAETSGSAQKLSRLSTGGKLKRHGSQPQTRAKPPHHTVSASTRELIAFLDEGPPEIMPSDKGSLTLPAGQKISEDGVLHDLTRSDSPTKSVGKLQRMLSKLSVGNSRRNKRIIAPFLYAKEAEFRANSSPDTTIHTPLNTQHPITTKSREGQTSPHSSTVVFPQSSSDIAGAVSAESSLNARRMSTAREPAPPLGESQVATHNRPPTRQNSKVSSEIKTPDILPPNLPVPTQSEGCVQAIQEPVATNLSRVLQGSSPSITAPVARDIRRLLENATSADECRVIFDMFMARSGIFPVNMDTPPPSATYIPGLESILAENLASQEVKGCSDRFPQ